ncbi:hypothetical protein B0T13DRAFT_401517 [Neurospora crassa]|nr:hypothetical protein B0T13DRAFT_401517 [Neurospora crassa]
MPVAAINDDFPTFAPDEKVHSYSHVAPIIDIVEINNTAAPNSEIHSYRHCAPLLEVVEIGNTSSPNNAAQPASDVGASASSVDYNDFERFFDEDRMWGIHRPATRKPSKVDEKKKIVPSVKVDEKGGKEVAVGASAAATNAPKGAVNTCTSSHPLQPGDISPQRMRKPSTDTDVSTSTCQTVDTDKSTSNTVTTIPDTNSSCSDVTSDAKSDAQPAQPFIIPWIALTEPSEISLEDANDIKSALQFDNGIPTKESLPSFTALYDYAPLNFAQEDLDNLWIMTILTRPGHAIKYAKVNCGFWYILEDEKNVRMMVEHEYQAFLEWIDASNVADTVNDQNNEPENSGRLEILEEYPEENGDVADEEEDEGEEAWLEIPQWRKRYELGRGGSILTSFNQPAYADRKYVLANDNSWYFEYQGKFRRLMEEEMDLLHRRRLEICYGLVDAIEGKSTTNSWGLANITEEEE